MMAKILRLSNYEPTARFSHRAAFVGGKAYHFGGYMPGYNDKTRFSLQSTIEAFDPYFEDWTQSCTRGIPPLGLYGGSFTAMNDLLYVIGGLDGRVKDLWHDSVHYFDPGQLEWKRITPKNPENGPLTKMGSGVAPFRGKHLAMFGGMALASNRKLQTGATFTESQVQGKGLTDEFHLLDVEEACWVEPTIHGARPPPSTGFSLTAIDEHRAVLFGGSQKDGRTSDAFIVDMDTMTWRKIGPPADGSDTWPSARSMHQACCINFAKERPHLLITGGVNDREETLCDAWLFDVDACSWQQVSLPVEFTSDSRCFHTLTATSLGPTMTQVLLFGGCSKWPSQDRKSYPAVAGTALLTLELVANKWTLVHATKSFGSPKGLREKITTVLRKATLTAGERPPEETGISGGSSESLPRTMADEDDPFWVVGHEEINITDKVLGTGGWAEVKVANFRGLEVAAKYMHNAIASPYNRRLFIREMNLASRIRHPNLLQFIGATLQNDRPLVILAELMPTNLRAVLEKSHLPYSHTLTISRDITLALNYLHLMKPEPIIHRDISSANVLLEPKAEDGWKAKVSDYGSANISRRLRTVAPGSATYAAPEAVAPLQQSTKMDIYSFGVLLVEICTHEFPSVDIRQHLIQKISGDELKFVPTIRQCLDDQPSERPSAQDLLTQLSELSLS